MLLYESLENLRDQAHEIMEAISAGNLKRKLPAKDSTKVAQVIGYIAIAAGYMNLADEEFDEIGSETPDAYPVKNPFDSSPQTAHATIDAKIATASIGHVRVTCDFLADATSLLERALKTVNSKDSPKLLRDQESRLNRMIAELKDIQTQCKTFAKKQWGGKIK